MLKTFYWAAGAAILVLAVTTSAPALVVHQSGGVQPDKCRIKNDLAACPPKVKYTHRSMSRNIDLFAFQNTLTNVTEDDNCQQIATISFTGWDNGYAIYSTVATGNTGTCQVTFRGMAGSTRVGPVKIKLFLLPGD